MAELFLKQAKQYAENRPDYPKELFEFIASKTPCHDLVWDVGTGSGQAAQSLAGIYKKVIATDTSPKQLQEAPKLTTIRYEHPPPVMSIAQVEQILTPKSSLDLVTIAQALHWFDFQNFYDQVKWALKKPNGVVAAWCYTLPRVNASVDRIMDRLYTVCAGPYWDPLRKFVDDEYRGIDFPFEAVEGACETGPFEFVIEKVMDLEGFFNYIRSWSAYQTAKDKGVELLGSDIVEEFKRAWENDEGGDCKKVVKCPLFLRIGKVGGDVE
ncbi:Putative methyltransferase [Morus notabilis]|uniref:Putative methyltransferase n=1 Tax=Morus notabilis TaxID=981085 RepID=W9QUH8_9ROSA|nr:putative methyltransferase DDB_G0268948 [Morus notabilis]EXB41195.1 Putative methyltransferase [Morus notabilis]